MPNAGEYKWLLQGKGSQIHINIIKQLLNSLIVRYEELVTPRFVLSASACHCHEKAYSFSISCFVSEIFRFLKHAK